MLWLPHHVSALWPVRLIPNFSLNSAGIYLLRVDKRNARTKCEIYSNLIKKTLKRRQWYSSAVFIINFELFFFLDTEDSRNRRGMKVTIFYSTLPLSPAHEHLFRHLFTTFLVRGLQGWTNFFLGARLFGHEILLSRPIAHAKNGRSKPKLTYGRDTTRNIGFVFYCLSRTCSFHFKCFFIKRFFNEAIGVWMLFECLK